MAGDWIKWTKGLAYKPEVIRIAEILCKDRHEIAGRLMVLWEWTDSNVTFMSRSERDTDEATVSLGDNAGSHLDSIVGLSGFADAMTAVGWLRSRNGSLSFPNLARHNGQTAKDRALASSRQQKSRGVKSEIGTEKTSRSKRDECHGESVTREEKRRIPAGPAAGFFKLTKKHLQGSKLLEWFREHVTSIGLEAADFRHVLATAVRIGSAPEARNHAAMLVDSIQNRRWELIEPKHFAEADRWLNKQPPESLP